MSWSVCVRNGTTSVGGTRSVTSLVAGKDVGGQGIADGQAVAVQAGGQSYVIWKNPRLHMPQPPNLASCITGVLPAGGARAGRGAGARGAGGGARAGGGRGGRGGGGGGGAGGGRGRGGGRGGAPGGRARRPRGGARGGARS